MLMKCLSTIGWIWEKTNTHQIFFSNNDLSCGHGHLLQVPVCQRKTLYFWESGTLLSRSKCTVSLGTPLFLTSTPTLLYITLHFCLFVAVVVVVIGRRLVLNGHSKHIKIWGWVLTIFDQGTQLVDLHYCVNWLTPSTPVQSHLVSNDCFSPHKETSFILVWSGYCRPDWKVWSEIVHFRGASLRLKK